MAKDASNDIDYFLEIPVANQDFLGNVRHWQNLKIGIENDNVWLRGFDFAQLHSVEVKSIPFKKLYSSTGAKLYLLKSLLPARNLPSVLWSPIESGLPVKLPNLNHNFFGLSANLEMELIATAIENEPIAMIAQLTEVERYIAQAPAIRVKNLKWCIVNQKQALIIGTPLLPINGEVFWQQHDFFIPAGYQFKLYSLVASLNQKLNANRKNWFLWDKNGSCFMVDKQTLVPLSLSSFRLSNSQSQ